MDGSTGAPVSKPLAIDLFCGLGGWTEGLLAEGWQVIGFDIEQHVYGEHRYPAQLVIQDVCTLHGEQFKDADLILASSPCPEYSYMAMPWSRAKQIASALRGRGDFPEGYTGSRTVEELNHLFSQAARIQREAIAAAGGRFIPLIQENVRGAIPWVGPSQWHYGSFHLWGNVPALMPKVTNNNPTRGVAVGEGVKVGGGWFHDAREHTLRRHSSKSKARKAASARIAKIPFPLAQHIARVYHPGNAERVA